MKEFKAVIFDLGNVLIDWNPSYVFHETYFPNEEDRRFFFENICTLDWNEKQDAGYPIAMATEEKVREFPEWESAIRDYYGQWENMLKGEISETVDIFRRLRQVEGLKIYALTNWSAETFHKALERFEFLHWFDGRVVSGEEKMRKPFPEFYHLLLNRYGLTAGQTVFIDDNIRNIKAAESIGIRTIHYTNPVDLETQLKDLRLLSGN